VFVVDSTMHHFELSCASFVAKLAPTDQVVRMNQSNVCRDMMERHPDCGVIKVCGNAFCFEKCSVTTLVGEETSRKPQRCEGKLLH
jgi:hypothetical protein